MLQGHLENIQEDGLITGWCWDPEQPGKRARLTVLVDNEPVGDLIADNFRPDLESAGIGDGAHAFAYLLPWSAIASKSVTSVHVTDPASRHPIGGALTFRRTALLPVEQRIADLEHKTRLLQARVEEANRHADRATALVQSTLATIGAFFTRLAETPLDALSQPGPSGIGRLLAGARAEFEPFAFAVPAAPVMTICISGEGGLGEIYGCLRALKACDIDEAAEIVVIDTDPGQESALIPLLVHNIRYWPVGGGSLAEARNRIADLGARDLLLFLSPAARMRAGWLEAVRAVLAAHPRCAILGSTVLRADGTIQSSALMSDAAGRLTDFGYAELPEAPWHNRLAPAAAVPEHALLIRRAVFTEIDGFDPAFVDAAAAATDLCLRCWEAGHSVLYQPGHALLWQEEAGIGTIGTAARDTGLDILLAERWQKAARPAWPAAQGRALIIDTSAGEATQQSAQALQGLGYDVAFGNVAGLGMEKPGYDALRAAGVAVLKAPYQPSVLAAIKAAVPAFDIIQLSQAAAGYLSPETVRPTAPGARILLALEEPGREEPARLAAALAVADAVLVPDEPSRQALAQAVPKKTGATAVLVAEAATARKGLWLLLDGPEAALQDAGRWLATLVPAIAKAVPGCSIHATKREDLRLPAGVKQHAAGTEDSALLGRMRLALAPFRQPALAPDARAACAAAGLPVIATPAALEGSEPPAPGIVEVAANAQAIGRLLRRLDDAAAWEALAAPLRPRPTAAHWLAAYRSLAKSLKLPAL